MVSISADIQERMNNLAYSYGAKFEQQIANTLKKSKFADTGSLSQSVNVVVQKANEYSPPVIFVEYYDYGNILEQKSPRWTSLPPVDKLETWVANKNLASAGLIPGYTNGAPNLIQQQKNRRIAWAIAWDKRKNDTWKRKRWKREALPDLLKEMNQDTLKEFALHIEKILADSITNG